MARRGSWRRAVARMTVDSTTFLAALAGIRQAWTEAARGSLWGAAIVLVIATPLISLCARSLAGAVANRFLSDP